MKWTIDILLKLGLWRNTRGVLSGSEYVFEFSLRTLWEFVTHFFLLISYLWLFVSFTWDLNGSGCNWFQRAGAVLVLAALTSEYFIFEESPKIVLRDFVEVSPRLMNIRRFFRVFGFFSIFLGTFIWAYGDLLISNYIH